MDVTRMLEADHREVEALFAEIEKAKGAARAPFIDQLATVLQAHMVIEEEVLYPGIESVVGKEAVQEGRTEHDLARQTLDAMLKLAPDEPGFGAALEAVKAGIVHHVEEEEGDMFPKARKQGPRLLEDLASPFMQRRMELGLPMTAEALSAASSKDELVQEAQNLGLEGASSMTKDELAGALADQMA